MRMALAALILIMNCMNTNAQTMKGGLQHAEQPYLTLNNGVRMPQVGLGLYMIAEGDEAYNSVMTALKNGYRHFDFAHYVDVKPMVNQLQCNTLIQQTAIEPLHAQFGTRMMAWGPLGGQGVDGIVKSPELDAIGSKYGKSAAQVALRWLTQRGIVAIPKSTHKERMAQNLDVFDFRLTDADMAEIAKLNQHDTGTINFGDPQFVKHLIENYG